VHAELRVDSISPSWGKLSEDLQITIKGNGFDGNTRVSLTIDGGNRRKILGPCKCVSTILDMAYRDNIIYAASGYDGMTVIDVSTATNPVVIGSIDTPGSAIGIDIFGNNAYIADGSSGLQIVDISNPSNPVIINSIDAIDDGTNDIFVSDNKAYIASGNDGLQILDISNPTNPVFIGSVDINVSVNSVFISGNFAYVNNIYPTQTLVVDISRATSPQLIGSIDYYVYGSYRMISNGVAYSSGSSGLKILDISTPINPSIIGSVDTPGIPIGVALSNNIAYVTDDLSGLEIIDVSDLANPVLIGSVDTPAIAMNIAISNNIAYVNDWTSLQVIDISSPSNRAVLGSFDNTNTSWDARDIAVIGDIAYMLFHGGIQLLDISSRNNPQLIDTVYLSMAYGITISGNYAYVAAYDNGLQIIDVSKPTSPAIIGSVDTPGHAFRVSISADTAFVADDSEGLQVIDVSAASNPVIVGSVKTPDVARYVAISGNYAYVGENGGGLQIIDISTKTDPKIISSINIGNNIAGVVALNNKVYVGDYGLGLRIIDVSVPENPVVIGSVDVPEQVKAISISGDKAYATDWSSRLSVIDISIPSTPVIIGFADVLGGAYAVTVSEEKVYVADGSAGITIPYLPAEIEDITVNSDTDITIKVPTLDPSGYYNLRVFNSSESDEKLGALFLSDNVKSITGFTASTLPDSIGRNSQIAISLEGDSTTYFKYRIDGGAFGNLMPASSPMSKSGLADGIHSIDVIPCTVDGYCQDVSVSYSWTIDTIPPVITGLNDTSNPVKETTWLWDASDITSTKYRYRVNTSPTWTPEGNFTDTKTDTLKDQEGTWYVHVQGMDAAGNIGEVKTASVILDNTPPVITGLENDTTPSNRKRWDWASADASTVTYRYAVDKNTTWPNPDGSFSNITSAVAIGKSGTWYLHVQAKDAAGNLSEVKTVSAEIDSNILQKAIILAGAGPYENKSNSLWEFTQYCTDKAYTTLLKQGFSKDQVCYLSNELEYDADGNGVFDDVDKIATNINFEEAIKNWADDATFLLIYVISHGHFRKFETNETEDIYADVLSKWLDAYQMEDRTVVLIFDFCYSGSFLSVLKASNRIVLCSASENEEANFSGTAINRPEVSYSYSFWNNICDGNNIYDSHKNAHDFLDIVYKYNDFVEQTALFDGNGDGLPDEQAEITGTIKIGDERKFASDGRIREAGSEDKRDNSKIKILYASNILTSYSVGKVWAIIVPPDYADFKENAASDFPVYDLILAASGRYEAEVTCFEKEGTYTVLMFASDEVTGDVTSPYPFEIEMTDQNHSAGPVVPNHSDDKDKNDCFISTIFHGRGLFGMHFK